jgi:hypothetical protein
MARKTLTLLAVFAAGLALAVGGCGEDDGNGGEGGGGATTNGSTTTTSDSPYDY